MYAVVYKPTFDSKDLRCANNMSTPYVSHLEKYSDAVEALEEFHQEMDPNENLFEARIIEHN